MPTDTLKYSEFMWPYKLNTTKLPHDLAKDEASELVNMWREGDAVVQRRGIREVTNWNASNYKECIGALKLDSLALYYFDASSLTSPTRTFFRPDSFHYIRKKLISANALEQNSMVTFTTALKYHSLNAGSVTTGSNTGAGTFHDYIPTINGIEYNGELYYIGAKNSTGMLSPMRAVVVADLPNYTANITFTNGSATATYTNLSPASSSLTGRLVQFSSAQEVYKVTAHTVTTSTTGSITLERAYTDTSGTLAGVNISVVAPMENWLDEFQLVTDGNYRPSSAAIYRERLFIGTCNGYITWSVPGVFSHPLSTNFIKTSMTAITGLMQFNGALYIFGNEGVQKLTGYDEGSFTLSEIISTVRCVDPSSVTIFKDKLYYASDDGLYSIDVYGDTVVNVSEPITDLWRSAYEANPPLEFSFEYLSRIHLLGMYNRFLVVAIHNPFSKALYNKNCYTFVYDTKYGAWSVLSTEAGNADWAYHQISRFNTGIVNTNAYFSGYYAITARGLYDIGVAFDAVRPTRLDNEVDKRDTVVLNYDVVAATDYSISGVCQTGLFQLNPEGQHKLHEVLVTHNSKGSLTQPNVGEITVLRDPYRPTNSPANVALPKSGQTTLVDSTYAPYYGVVMHRLMSPTSIGPECTYSGIRYSSYPTAHTPVAEWREVNIVLSRYSYRWEPVRQFTHQEDGSYL